MPTLLLKSILPQHIVLTLYLLLNSFIVVADAPLNDANENFIRGQTLYNRENYLEALPYYQKAVELAPVNSVYHHMLGKCHGRIAETGSWLSALRHVRKTLKEFKKAVELDADNRQAWLDLEELYRRAPGFLGGDKRKAKEILEYLDTLENSADSNNGDSEIADRP